MSGKLVLSRTLVGNVDGSKAHAEHKHESLFAHEYQVLDLQG